MPETLTPRPGGYLQIMECDPRPLGGDGRVLGGAGFDTARETRERYRAIPGIRRPADDEYEYVLDRLDANGDMTRDTKTISLTTALTLLGGTLHEHRVAAEADTAAKWEEMRARSANPPGPYRPVFVAGTEERQR